jgi:hypothetical protein
MALDQATVHVLGQRMCCQCAELGMSLLPRSPPRRTSAPPIGSLAGIAQFASSRALRFPSQLNRVHSGTGRRKQEPIQTPHQPGDVHDPLRGQQGAPDIGLGPGVMADGQTLVGQVEDDLKGDP